MIEIVYWMLIIQYIVIFILFFTESFIRFKDFLLNCIPFVPYLSLVILIIAYCIGYRRE